MKYHKSSFWKAVFFLLLCHSVFFGNAQRVFNGQPIALKSSETEKLNELFTEQTVFELDLAAFHSFVKSNAQLSHFQLKIGEKHLWEIDLMENEMRPPYYVAEQTGPFGRVEVPRSECITYAGSLTGSPDQIVRLNIEKKRVWGYIKDHKGLYYIEPLNRFVKDANDNSLVVYDAGSVVPHSTGTCGASHTEHTSNFSEALQPGIEKMAGDDCRKLEIATESDWEFYDDGHTFSDIVGNLNLVEGIYQTYFDMAFLVVYQHEWTTSNDPYTNNESGCDGWGILDEFAEYWFNNFGNVRRDINVLYSEKDFNGGTIGCAMTGEFGNNENNNGWVNSNAVRGAYCVNEWIDNIFEHTEADRTTLVAHEMGHLFGADHDISAINIMHTPLEASAEFLSTAQTEMTADMDHASPEENDGRSALRIRDWPINSQNNTPEVCVGITFTGNQWVMDGEMVLDSQCPTTSSPSAIFQATENIILRPGFKATPTSNKNLKLKIGSCNLNGF